MSFGYFLVFNLDWTTPPHEPFSVMRCCKENLIIIHALLRDACDKTLATSPLLESIRILLFNSTGFELSGVLVTERIYFASSLNQCTGFLTGFFFAYYMCYSSSHFCTRVVGYNHVYGPSTQRGDHESSCTFSLHCVGPTVCGRFLVNHAKSRLRGGWILSLSDGGCSTHFTLVFAIFTFTLSPSSLAPKHGA